MSILVHLFVILLAITASRNTSLTSDNSLYPRQNRAGARLHVRTPDRGERVQKLENRFAELKRLRISAADPSRTELASLPLALSFLIWKVKLSLECFV